MKKENLIDYVKKYGDKSFIAQPFNELDAAILACLTYLNYQDLVPTIDEINKDTIFSSLDHQDLYDYLLKGAVTPKNDRKLIDACFKSHRFSNLRMNYVLSYFCKIKTIQFYAITYILDDDTAVVAFRGTDTSIVGWKEDLYMAIDENHPSFAYADIYLSEIAKILPDRKLIVLGHSKGGALAFYAASFVDEEVQKRIVNVFDLDGPGLKYSVKHNESFKRIESRIIKIVPEDSIIGILLETKVKKKIVKGNYFSIAQHILYSWVVKDKHFVPAKKQTLHSKSFENNIKEFLMKLDESEKRAFIEILFSVLEESEIHNTTDVLKSTQHKLFLGAKSLSRILKDEEKSKTFKKVVALFVHTYLVNIGRVFVKNKNEIDYEDIYKIED